MVEQHDLLLRGAGFLPGAGARPTVLERTDQEFLPAILARLGDAKGQGELAASQPTTRTRAGRLKLFQPIHRTFNVVLVEAVCDIPGRPRLDPRQIESAGLVVRRLAARDGAATARQGWMETENRLRGWLPLTGAQADQDPEAARRPRELRAGNREIDRRLAKVRGDEEKVRERISPLFVAPPDLCAKAGRTLLYGLLPVTSSEVSEAPPRPAAFPDEEFNAHLSQLLKSRRRRSYSWTNRTLRASDLDSPGRHADLDLLVLCLEQLSIELGAFGDSAAGRALLSSLDKLRLSVGGRQRGAGALLRDASRVLLDRSSSPSSVLMPDRWPAIPGGLRREIRRRAQRAANERLAAISPGEARFADLDRLYEVRAFLRARRSAGCPPRLVWSEASEPFAIAPWYDSGDAPPARISLPDATNRDFLKGLKPNVAFEVPESIFNKLRGSKLGDLMDGKSGDGGGIGLGWICSFSIPIITLCAFIVLSVFLSLLNFIFFWLPFVKICIPYPKRTE